MTGTPSPDTSPSPGVRFGTAYYPEYFPPARVSTDLDLMRDAHLDLIRVGESVWSTWEPEDGRFELDWLEPVLDQAHARGIRAILGTPTYAVPPWLQRKHPDIAAQSATGVPVGWGGRQEIDYSAPEFRRHAERVVRQVVGRYADHPAVIGYQVDNEPGLHLLHNPRVFARFVDDLREQYGDVERLNEAWGLVYWSHRLTGFEELWLPDGNTLPQYDLAWRRCQARLVQEFLDEQARIVRELARPDQFVTTCLAYARPAVDDVAIMAGLDVTAANLYYGMQDHLTLGLDLPRVAPWTVTGVSGLLLGADRAYASRQERFLVTETNASGIGDSDQNYPPYPGQLRQAALALVSRGASLVEYWHWNTLPYGTETYWGGVLPHSGRPGRVYAEVRELGATLQALAPVLGGFRPDHDLTLLWSTQNRWAYDFFPPLPAAPAGEHGGAYGLMVEAFYRGVAPAGAQAAVLNDTQLVDLPPAALVADHPVLLVPTLHLADDRVVAHLRDYARAGGHLLLGPRSLYADETARVRVAPAPYGLDEDAGVRYEEASNLREPVPLERRSSFPGEDPVHATYWADGLLPQGSEEVLGYRHRELGRFPALTTRRTGAGRISYLGTVPDPALAEQLLRWLVPSPRAAAWSAGPSVTVASGVNEQRQRVWFVHNWSGDAVQVTVPTPVTDVESGAGLGAGARLDLPPRGARVLLEEA